MKDFLLDLIQHTHALGVIELIKIDGDDKETKFSAYSEDRTVIVSGSFKTPVDGFKGTFGMPNLSKLKTILGFEDYNETSTIEVLRQDEEGVSVPSSIHFETTGSDFVNDYRLMSKKVIEDKIKTVTFKGAKWDVEFKPSLNGIQRLKKQASANSEENNFVAKTDGSDLKIYFGNPSSHSGNFVFQTDITGKLAKPWNWPVKVFLSIMDLPGDKMVRFADAGAAEITVDSGLANYRYLLPAQAK